MAWATLTILGLLIEYGVCTGLVLFLVRAFAAPKASTTPRAVAVAQFVAELLMTIGYALLSYFAAQGGDAGRWAPWIVFVLFALAFRVRPVGHAISIVLR
jgi:hypothetical protein